MKKSIIAAGAASVALAAMPIVGVFAEPTPDQQATDTIQVTVNPSCTFKVGSGAATYTASGNNSAGRVTPSKEGGDNVHSFTVFCNNNGGYNVTATAQNLAGTNVPSNVFTYATSLPTSESPAADKVTGKWNAAIAPGTGLTDGEITPITAAATNTKIVSHNAASIADGEVFTVTYSAWIGTATPADTYSGTISYTLATGA